MAWLAGDEVRPAPRVDAETARRDGDGEVTANVERGSLLLVSGHDAVRLVFTEKDQALPVAPGTYRIFNYAIETERDGEFWALSGSGPNGKSIVVTEGKRTIVKLDTRIHLSVVAQVNKGNVAACAGLSGDSKMGISILRGEKQIPLSFEIRNRSGERVDGGDLAYG